jgi:hypothetical protein
LLLTRDRRLDGTALERLLTTTSHSIATPAGTFRSIDACAAVVAAQRHGTCPATRALAKGEPRDRSETARTGP